MTVGWTPTVEEGARFLARRARAGDTVVTMGAGNVDEAVPLLFETLA
jgi:UDP-N-acetylmuramate-alanine ligase